MARSRFYRALLRAYPRSFRDEFGDEMEAAYLECAARERHRPLASIRIPVRALLDTAAQACQVRIEERRSRRLAARSMSLAQFGAGRHPPSEGLRMSQMLQDVRYAWRALAKDRGFTATVLLTLALCIGANAAIFSIVQSVLLRPLAVPGADRLVNIIKAYPKAGVDRGSSSVPDYYDRLEAMDTLEELALYRRTGATVGLDTGAERLMSVQATPSLFHLLGASPARGRLFQDADAEPGNDLVVVISDGLWRTHFGARPDIIGQALRVNGTPRTIVGVMPQHFQFLWPDISLWTPLAFTPAARIDDQRHSNNYQTIGRLAPGANVEQAQAQLDAIDRRNEERVPELRKVLRDAGFHTRALPFQEDLVREVRPVLLLLWGGVLFVLVIGAVNITNLVIVRSGARERELATRHAIGAGIGRLARQLVTETLILAAAGGVLGLLLGRWALGLVSALGLEEMPRSHEITMSPATMAIVLVIALGVGLLVSVVPVVRMWRLNLNQALRDSARGGTASPRSMLARRALATAQVGLAFLLLIGAGLLFASFRHILGVDPGFTAAGVVSGQVSLPRARYPDAAALRSFAERALERLRSAPGIERVGITDTLPFGGSYSDSVILAEGAVMAPGESLVSPTVTSVSDGYFETMEIELLAGRYFDGRDTADAPRVAVIDRKLAGRFWPGQDPVGRRLFTPGSGADPLTPGPSTTFYTVVGVVENVTLLGLTEEPRRVGAYYFPLAQRPTSGIAFVTRTGLPPETAAEAMRRELAAIDPELPLYGVLGMTDRVDQSLVNRRMPMLLAVAFGAVALFLSTVGIYGVLAYQVAQRRREIGIRMALGSTIRAVFRLVVLDGARIVGVGLVLGLAGALIAGSYIESQLFGVQPLDPMVIGTVALLLAAVSFAAISIPARRAARVSPLVAMTSE